MSRLQRLVRPRLSVEFCDGCATVTVCDAGCRLHAARAAATVRALATGLRL